MMNLRIVFSTETVNKLVKALQGAYQAGDAQMVKRVGVLLDLSRGESVSAVAERHGVSRTSVYEWLRSFMVEGEPGLKPTWKGGRPAKLTKLRRKELVKRIKAGPLAAGFVAGGWNSAMIQELIRRDFGVLYNVHYVCDLLKGLGFSFQKARFISDHLDEGRRLAWLTSVWPDLLQRAQPIGGAILFGDEASFAQWGSLGYTWAPKGQQPTVPTSGKRRAYKVFGLIEFFSGRLFCQGIQGKFNSQTYIAFLQRVLRQTRGPLFLIQDGARYHTSKLTRQFFAQHSRRLTVFQLPSYSPDYNPIEYLWRNVKKDGTHLKYFPTFESLIQAVDTTLAAFQKLPARVKALFGLYLDQMAQPAAVAA